MKKSTRKTADAALLKEADVREVVDQMLRDAFASYSRDMEGHLKDIHKRIQSLEKRRP